MEIVKDCDNELITKVLDCAFEVHRNLGPGLLEAIYEMAMMVELTEIGITARRQVDIPVVYKGMELEVGFRADIIVNDCLLLELKSVDELTNIHQAQVMTYLKILKFKRGLLLNFNKKLMKEGIKRVAI